MPAVIHPSGLETCDFEIYEPNRHQIESAARRGMRELSPRPPCHVRVSLGWFLLFAFALGLGTCGGTYIVLWWVLR